MSNRQLSPGGLTGAAGPQPESKATERLHTIDWVLVAAALCLTGVGLLAIASATWAEVGPALVQRQVVALLMALSAAVGISLVDARTLKSIAAPTYIVSLCLMLATFTPLGLTVAGARAWLAIPGGFTLQPSELGKLATFLLVAAVLGGGRTRGDTATGSDLLRAGAVVTPVLLIVLAQRDTGTAMVIVSVFLAMAAISGVPWQWLVATVGVGVGAVVLAFASGLVADYQLARLRSFIDPWSDPLGAGHNTIQSQTAVGSGGWFGLGWGTGPQTQGGFVPVNESDFIFSVIAEEGGFALSVITLILYAVLIWRGLLVAFGAADLFGRVLATGIVAWFSFQAFENIGMTLGIMPVTGVTLPFVSYGGSSLIAAWLGVGLLQLLRNPGRTLRSGT